MYNFSTDFILREQYRDPWNEVRIGKLLEDLDALAGTISVKVISTFCCCFVLPSFFYKKYIYFGFLRGLMEFALLLLIQN